jgi:hypothetical protein
MARLFVHPTDPLPPPEYRVARTDGPVHALLDSMAAGWDQAGVIEWGHDRYRTRFRAAWANDALAVRFDCDDDAPWWTLTEKDRHLWEEEVVEIFLDPAGDGRDYVEVEVNPANVVCDLRVRTPWPSLSSDPTWDWVGLTSRVDRHPGPEGRMRWTMCAVLPFAGLAGSVPGAERRLPPRPGDRWRFNVFRIKRPHGPADPERDVVYAAWSVPPGPSFHDPSVFRDLVFGD